MNSIYLETRTWLDRTYGNSYFASQIHYNGKVIATLPFQYGYGNQDEYNATRALVELGILPESSKYLALSLACRDAEIILYTSKSADGYRSLTKWAKHF